MTKKSIQQIGLPTIKKYGVPSTESISDWKTKQIFDALRANQQQLIEVVPQLVKLIEAVDYNDKTLNKKKERKLVTRGPGLIIHEQLGVDRVELDKNYLDNLIEAAPSGSDFPIGIPCKITGYNAGGEYSIAIHENGVDYAKTADGTLHVLELHTSERLRVGTWVVGHISKTVTLAGG